jgi:hypothetical protein
MQQTCPVPECMRCATVCRTVYNERVRQRPSGVIRLPLYVDRESLPLLRLRYVGEYSVAELTEFLRELDAVLDLPRRKACLIDLTGAKPGSATQRQMQANWIGEREEVLARGFSAAALVTDSAIIRGAITAVFWIRPLPFPTQVTPTLKSAEEWLEPFLSPLLHE